MNARQLELSGSSTRSSTNDTTITAYKNIGIKTDDTIPLAILSAAVSTQPEKGLFRDTLINGRPLADLNNSGIVSSADTLSYQRWQLGIFDTQESINWIQNVMHPYMLANPSTYSAYLTNSEPLAKNETVLFYKQLNNVTLPNVLYLKAETAQTTTSTTFTWSYTTDLNPTSWTIIAGATTDLLVLSNTAYLSYLGSATSVIFKVECNKVGYATSSANFTVYYYKESDEVVQAFINNSTVSVICNELGNPVNTDNTGAVISVFVNGKAIPYNETIADTFSIGTITQSPANSVTLGTPAPINNTYVYPDIVTLVNESTVVTFPVIIRNKYGLAKPTINLTQKFTKIQTTNITLDTTPAPTPTGVEITPGLTSIFIKHDNPVYTQGGGHDKTLIYAVEDDTTGTQTIAQSENVGQFTGTIGTFQSTIGKSWRVWLKWITKSGYPSTTAFGGVNGYLVTTSKIGTNDLGPLIVEAGNLANLSVSAEKLANEAIQVGKFATGIEPLSIVAGSTLPATKSTTSIFLEGTKKIYRWNGTEYVATVPAADIIDQLTAGQIAAGAISAEKIAAGAISTDKLLVTGQGPAINPDPNTVDISAWEGGNFSIVDDAESPTGKALSVISSGATTYSKRFALDATKNYNIRTTVKRITGSATTYLLVAFYNANNDLLSAISYGEGWPYGGTFHYFGLGGEIAPTSYTEYKISFGPNETAKIPPGTRYARVGMLANYSGGAGEQRFTSIRLFEKASADLIVDGSIIATKLAAGSIAVGTAAIQNGAIVNAMIGDATIENAKIASLDAAKINTGYLSADRIDAGSINASKIKVSSKGGLTILSDDPLFQDPAYWDILSPNVAFESGTSVTGAKGSTYIISTTGTDRQFISNRYYEIDPTQTYRLSALLYRRSDSDKNMYLFLEFYDYAYNYVGSASTGWGGSKSGYTYGGVPPTAGVFQRLGEAFGPNTGLPIPSNVRYCKIGGWFNYSGNGTTVAPQAIQDLRLDQYINGGSLIVDGSITANKIDTRNLTIKDSAGNVILSAGDSLDFSRVGGTTKPANNANNTYIDSNGLIYGVSSGGGTEVSNTQAEARQGRFQWRLDKYSTTSSINVATTVPNYNLLNQATLQSTTYISNTTTSFTWTDENYFGVASCTIYSPSAWTWSLTVGHDDAARIYINGQSVYSNQVGSYSVSLNFPAGWSTLEMMWAEQVGGDYFNLSQAISARTEITDMWAGVAPVGSIASASTTAVWNGVSGSGRPQDNATVGATAGVNLFDSSNSVINTDSIRNNLANVAWWTRDATIPWSQNSEYNRIIQVPNDVNIPGPRGGSDYVWYAEEVNNNGESGGGWDGGGHTPLDTSKTYRFVVPIREIQADGTAYWGTSSVCNLNTTNVNGNPYFAATNLPNQDRWYLFVGYIFPYGSTGNTHDGAGVWDCKTGKKYADGANWNFGTTGMVYHRAYKYYSSQGSKQVFGRPMINLVDGTEPSLREYFESTAVLNNDITIINGVVGGIGPGSGTQVDNTYQTIGKNLIPNSEQTQSKCFGGLWNPYGAYLETFNRYAYEVWGTDSYTLNGVTTKNIYTRQEGNLGNAGNTVIAFDTYPTGGWGRDYGIAVVAGQRYIFSCYIATHRCYFQVGMAFWDTAGNSLAWHTSNIEDDASDNLTNRLENYARPYVIGTAPAGAVSVSMYVRKYNTFDNQGDSYIWYAAPMLEAAASNAQGPSPYMAGPPTSTRQLGFTGALDATKGATFGVDIGGQITEDNVSTYIASAAIDSARIKNLAVSKLSAGNLSVGNYIASSNYVGGSAGWIINSDGNAEFEGVVIRRSQRVAAGTIYVGQRLGYYDYTQYANSVNTVIETWYGLPDWVIGDIKNTYIVLAGVGSATGSGYVTKWGWFSENNNVHIRTTVNNIRHVWRYDGGATLQFEITVEGYNFGSYGGGQTGLELTSGIAWGIYKVT